MTIDEAVHRVVRGHWRLILVCLVLPVAVVFYVSSAAPVMYEAVGRLQFGTTLASSNVEADAASTRALGIVTSPGVVEQALAEAGLDDDPVTFALDHIDVRRVGVSTVIEVAVSNESPGRAALVATSLTNQLLKFSNSGDRQAEIDQVASLDAKIAALTKARDALIPKLVRASPGEQLSLQAKISGIQTALADDLRQRSDLIVSAASRSSTALLDPVRTSADPLPKGTIQLSAIAGLLGLIGGIGLAAGLETWRPTLRSPKAISYALGAPVIGHLAIKDLEPPHRAAAMSRVADRMALLGLRHHTSRAMLLPVRRADQVRADEVAQELASNGNAGTSHRLQCASLNGHWVEPGDHPAIVVFSPARIRGRELGPVQELISSVDWPLLGVVTYDRPRRFSFRRADHPVTDPVTFPMTDPVKHALAHRRAT